MRIEFPEAASLFVKEGYKALDDETRKEVSATLRRHLVYVSSVTMEEHPDLAEQILQIERVNSLRPETAFAKAGHSKQVACVYLPLEEHRVVMGAVHILVSDRALRGKACVQARVQDAIDAKPNEVLGDVTHYRPFGISGRDQNTPYIASAFERPLDGLFGAGGVLFTEFYKNAKGQDGACGPNIVTLSPLYSAAGGLRSWIEENANDQEGIREAFDRVGAASPVAVARYLASGQDKVRRFHQASNGAVLASLDPGQSQSVRDAHDGGGWRVGWMYKDMAVRSAVRAFVKDHPDRLVAIPAIADELISYDERIGSEISVLQDDYSITTPGL